MPTLTPLRNYDEKDVIPFFSFSGALPVNKGTLVTIAGSGLVQTQDPVEMLGSPGASFSNTVSQRYGVPYKVSLAGTGSVPLGITLFDIKETDENGELLKFNPRKAKELEAVISGQNVPIVTKGMFGYSGITGAVAGGGVKLFCGVAGAIDSIDYNTVPKAIQVGISLGAKDANGITVILLDVA